MKDRGYEPDETDELREQILFQGEVSFDTYDEDSRTARKLVKIPIDDLMHLISTHVVRALRVELIGLYSLNTQEIWDEINSRLGEIDAELNYQKSQKEGE